MKKFQFGYVGKSVIMATVGIAATIITACGGGGSTTAGTPSSFVLYASMYHKVAGAIGEPWVRTTEGGNVYEFKGAAFNRSWGTDTDDDINYRQAFGVQFAHNAAITDTNYFGLEIKAPIKDASLLPIDSNSIDISSTSDLLIQLGNGAVADNVNSHMKYNIVLNAGTKDNNSKWSYSCSYQQTLDPVKNRPGAKSPSGIQQFKIPLANFTCSSATALASVKAALKEVVVKVVGGDETGPSASVANNDTLLLVGHIAFVK